MRRRKERGVEARRAQENKVLRFQQHGGTLHVESAVGVLNRAEKRKEGK